MTSHTRSAFAGTSSPLPSPQALKASLPIQGAQAEFLDQARLAVSEILHGVSDRLLIVAGPCSVHDTDAAYDYACRLKKLSDAVKDQIMLVMRCHTEKPRTTIGWKGLVYDPFLDGSNNIGEGLQKARSLLLRLADLKLPVSTEFLDPIIPHYYGDLISIGSVGARTSASQTHRQMASGLSIPMLFKNPTDGAANVAMNAVVFAKRPHAFLGCNGQGEVSYIQTSGNPNCMIVLRGSEAAPNWQAPHLEHVYTQLASRQLPPHLLIDCSHDNSRREHGEQKRIFEEVVGQIVNGNDRIRGLMLESFIEEGRQPIAETNALTYGQSVTDACLSWETTEAIIRRAYERLQVRQGALCATV